MVSSLNTSSIVLERSPYFDRSSSPGDLCHVVNPGRRAEKVKRRDSTIDSITAALADVSGPPAFRFESSFEFASPTSADEMWRYCEYLFVLFRALNDNS